MRVVNGFEIYDKEDNPEEWAKVMRTLHREPKPPRVYQYTALRNGRRVKYATPEEAKAAQLEQRRLWGERNPEKVAERQRRMNARDRMRTAERRRLLPPRMKVDRSRKRRMKAIWKLDLLFSQGYRCVQCASFFRDAHDCHGDHILPRALGGPDDKENMQLLCSACNMHKLDRHPLDHARRMGLL